MADKTVLGNKMKRYQAVTDVALPKDGYNILQLDGNAFHTYTKGFQKPFDERFVAAMNQTAIFLMENTPTAKFAYVQSDEINILLYADQNKTRPEEPYFNNRVEKVVSISAAKASVTMSFLFPEKNPAFFDARFFNLPDKQTVAEHFIWRQRDCVKNSINTVAQAVFGRKNLFGKNTHKLREMLATNGTPWEDYADEYKTGRLIIKVPYTREVTYIHKGTGREETVSATGYKWAAVPAPKFDENKNRPLENLIPTR